MPSLNKRRRSSKNKKRRRGGRVAAVAVSDSAIKSPVLADPPNAMLMSPPVKSPNLAGTKTQGVNPFDYIMEEHLKLFDTLRDKIVEEKATDLPTLIDAFSNFVIEQIRSMPEEVKAANQVERHITEFEKLRTDVKNKKVTVDQTNLPFSNLTPEELNLFDPFVNAMKPFVNAMKGEVKETQSGGQRNKVGGAKTKKARKKSKRRKTSKRRRGAGGPDAAMVLQDPNRGTGRGRRSRLIFGLIVAFIVIGWAYLYTFLRSSYENQYFTGNLSVAQEAFASNQTIFQRLRGLVFAIGEQDASNAFNTIDTIFAAMYNFSGGWVPLPVHHHHHPTDIGNWLTNSQSATGIYHIKFLFIDIVMTLLYTIGFIQYRARLFFSTTEEQKQYVTRDWEIIQCQIIAIKMLMNACSVGIWWGAYGATIAGAPFRAALQNPPAFAYPPSITGADSGQGQFCTLMHNSLLGFGNAGVARIGNVLNLQSNARGGMAQLSYGSGGGGTPLQLGIGSGGGGGSGSGSGWMRRRLGLRPIPPLNWDTMSEGEKEQWRNDEQEWFQNNVSLKRGP